MTIKGNRKDTGICGALFYFGNATSGHQKYTVGNARLQEELRYLNTDVKRRFGKILKSYLLNIKGKGCSIKSSPYGICSSGAVHENEFEHLSPILRALSEVQVTEIQQNKTIVNLSDNDKQKKKNGEKAISQRRKGPSM